MPSEHKFTQEQRIIMALRSSNPQDQQQALDFMRSNPDMAQKVKYIPDEVAASGHTAEEKLKEK